MNQFGIITHYYSINITHFTKPLAFVSLDPINLIISDIF